MDKRIRATSDEMREQWIAHHREHGHLPYAAATKENPERWECKCDPDAHWTAVWRILTLEQITRKFAHLKRNARTGAPAPGQPQKPAWVV